ncbi:MAG: hypothetical protein ABJN42_31655 [Roseibium sp.]|uniref:hypothetical protein n=1 Tax=Roseibium sp. TaxID=1936156 RepID=UPI003299741A
MPKFGEVKTPVKRTGGAKKIDEWRVSLPGGDKAVFDIGLEFGEDGGIFTATSKHASFKGFKIGHSDINILKERIEDHARELVETSLAEGWEPARVVEVRVNDGGLHGGRRLGISLNYDPVEHRPEHPVGNRGETSLRTEHKHMTVIQRAMADDFSDLKPKSSLLTDPTVRELFSSPFREELHDQASRVVVPGDGEDVDAVFDALKRFGELLADRMSWQKTSMEGPIAPDEMVDLMHQAVSPDAEDTPTP